MASIESGKKGAPSVDMTPMVDLGFLLITFFMLATTFSKPKTMEIIKPAKNDEEDKAPPLKKSRSLSVLLGERDKAYFYVASDEDLAKGLFKVDSADFSAKGVRGAIINRQNEVAQQYGSKDTLVVLIKLMPTAKYKNMVDILDEMRITGVKSYALVDLDKLDTVIMENTGVLKKK
jgi:biopolymer transport protein ExbD